MSGPFSAVDLSALPAPIAVEQIDFEVILSDMIADLVDRDPSFTALLESDPAYKILEVSAYREVLVRQRANEAVKAVMLAYAKESDLDHLGANLNVKRLIVDFGDDTAIPPRERIYESDTDFRRRILLSFEGFSTAGPRGAYVFHAIGADPDVQDAAAFAPPEDPGVVRVAVLSRTGSGSASTELLDTVYAALNADDIRPLTDHVVVESAEILNYSVSATLTFSPGPDVSVVIQSARDALDMYIGDSHKLGCDITLSGIYAALHRPGVSNVDLLTPSANIAAAWYQAPHCTAINIVNGGVNE